MKSRQYLCETFSAVKDLTVFNILLLLVLHFLNSVDRFDLHFNLQKKMMINLLHFMISVKELGIIKPSTAIN